MPAITNFVAKVLNRIFKMRFAILVNFERRARCYAKLQVCRNCLTTDCIKEIISKLENRVE